ncbi:MAG: protein kinase, partial [Myxococcota bacterium]|nr:protein kinase [Myxococcota bacterium]
MDFTGRILLGRYRLMTQLGAGGMGTVWTGEHLRTGRKVAVKLLDERFLSNAAVVQRFGREARAASAIQHPGIVEVLDLDQTEEGIPFLVMELLSGEPLSRRIETRGKLSLAETAPIMRQLLEALDAAHEHGVVHRDLKPDNVFLVPRGRLGESVKILDFGISRKHDEQVANLTVAGSVLGTPHYMSPEQALGEIDVDRRADLYAAGVCFYECLVGDVPFDAPNYNKLIQVILNDEVVPPSRRGADVTPAVEQVILRALAKDRRERWQSAREMRAALDEALRAPPFPRAPELAEPREKIPSTEPVLGALVIEPSPARKPSITDRHAPTVAAPANDARATHEAASPLDIDESALADARRRSARSLPPVARAGRATPTSSREVPSVGAASSASSPSLSAVRTTPGDEPARSAPVTTHTAGSPDAERPSMRAALPRRVFGYAAAALVVLVLAIVAVRAAVDPDEQPDGPVAPASTSPSGISPSAAPTS